VLSNPLVAASLVGVLYNVLMGAAPLPRGAVSMSVEALCETFSFCALFLVGNGCIGSGTSLRGRGVFKPAFLTLAKILITPILMQAIFVVLNRALSELPAAGEGTARGGGQGPANRTQQANRTQHVQAFMYIYGSLPTAPSTLIVANQYVFVVCLFIE
jgi:predicted permease